MLYEAYAKIDEANFFFEEKRYHDSNYAAYSSVVQSAKAFLVKKGELVNSKVQITASFEEYYSLVQSKFLSRSFTELIDGIKQADGTALEGRKQIELAERFHLLIDELDNEK